MTEEPRPKRTRDRSKSGKPLLQTIRMEAIRYDKAVARFYISEDIMLELLAMHDRLYGSYYYHHDAQERQKMLRMSIARLADMHIPAVFMRIEAPTFNPVGYKLRRPKNSRRYIVEIKADKIRLRPGVKTQVLDWYYIPNMPGGGGVMVNFADEDFDFPPRETPAKKGRGKASAGNESLAIDSTIRNQRRG